jgi:hypothetical protein
MSFVTWLALPVAITLVASLIMALMSRQPRTDTHQDIESFARFRGALARQMSAAPPDGRPSPRRAKPPADADAASAPGAVSNAAVVEDRQRPAPAGVAASPER